ncbi:MAG: hypothetical protein AAF960_13040 [Bacteroidota bacterium]
MYTTTTAAAATRILSTSRVPSIATVCRNSLLFEVKGKLDL